MRERRLIVKDGDHLNQADVAFAFRSLIIRNKSSPSRPRSSNVIINILLLSSMHSSRVQYRDFFHSI